MSTATAEAAEGTEVADWAEGRIAELMGVVNAAMAEVVSVTAKVIESGAWAGVGSR